jgi:ribonucleoside-diphosphate reductase alpha chain
MLEFPRLLSQENTDPYASTRWTKHHVVTRDKSGKILYECSDAEYPESWSLDACSIFSQKYLRQSRTTTERETSAKQTFSRIVSMIAAEGVKQKYFDTDNAIVFSDELTQVLLKQLALFNSPVLFNVGIPGIEKPLASACFINSVEDNMESILELAKTEGLIYKEGAGSGVNFSNLRASTEGIRGGGNASGPVSFMYIYDAVASIILSGGRTRRAAKMCILNADHPDVETFIWSKANQEDIVKILVAGGLSPEFQDPDGAYSLVRYQNENHSVRVTDEFMKRVREVLHGYKEDFSWHLTNRTDASLAEIVSIKNLFESIAEAAHKCGDPGIQFHDTINRMNTCSNDGEIHGSNPCSEFMWLDNSACNLASINLDRFTLPDRNYDVKTFKHVIRLLITAQDILVGMAGYPTKRIEENSLKYRPLGLGYSNLGGLLMAWGIPYDSDDGRNLAAAITSLMTGQAYLTSAELAEIKGPFERYEANKQPMEDVLSKHVASTKALKKDMAGIHTKALTTWREAMSAGFGKKEAGSGFRNCQVTLLAPTGTIAFVMDCATTGIEPDYSLKKIKALIGGEILEYVNPNIDRALTSLGYPEKERIDFVNYVNEHGHLEKSGLKEEHLAVFDCSVAAETGTRALSVDAHIEMVAAVQPFLSGAISKTFNMATNASVKEVQLTFLKAWERGVKAITVYRKGSKLSEPMRVRELMHELKKKPALQREELPNDRIAHTHKFSVSGYVGYLIIGFYEDGRPGEMFLRMAKPGSMVSGLLDSFAKSCSFLLQYGVPVEELVRGFEGAKFSPSGITSNPDIVFATSIIDYVFKWMKRRFLTPAKQTELEDKREKKFLEAAKASPEHDVMDYDLSEDPCPNCGSPMVKTGACSTCPVCSYGSGVCS